MRSHLWDDGEFIDQAIVKADAYFQSLEEKDMHNIRKAMHYRWDNNSRAERDSLRSSNPGDDLGDRYPRRRTIYRDGKWMSVREALSI